MNSTPPRLFRAFLRRALPKDLRDSTVADLQEMYAKRLQTDGAFRAGLWYRLQAISFIARFAFERPRFSLIDWKLGFRMLIKYPGLSIVSGLALMTAIGFGTTFTHVLLETYDPEVGLEEGDRVVRMDRFEVADQTPMAVTVMELGIWRDKATQLVDIGGYRTSQRNLTDPGRSGAVVEATVGVAEITPSGFDLARVRPLLGRRLTEEDARPGAQKAVVIGYDVWQNQLGADPRVLGREVGLGRDIYTVVGVMPEEFEFPNRRTSEVWIALQTGNLLPGTTLDTFARLAPNATIESAAAELEVIGGEAAATIDREASSGESAAPATRTHPRVIGFAKPDPSDFPLIAFLLPILLIIISIVVAAANAATLVFARTAMREGEIIVRSAMGASRGRILGQLFAEAMVLSGVAGVLGLVGAQAFINYMSVSYGNDGIIDTTFDPITIAATAGFSVLAAAVIGFLPALKATSSRVQEGIKNVGGGGTNLGFGGVWSVIIVLQVAITVAALPFGVDFAQSAMMGREIRSRFPAESFLSFNLVIDPPGSPEGATPTWVDGAASSGDPVDASVSATYAEVERRLASEPGVEGIAFASTLPGIDTPEPPFETESKSFEAEDAQVGVGYLDLFDVPLVAGRTLNSGDVDATNNPVVVNEAFARALGGTVVGTRVRRGIWGPWTEPGEWLEIVGVVKDMNVEPGKTGQESPFVFTPIAPAEAAPLRVAVKTQGEPAAMMNRVRDIVREVDPTIRVNSLLPLEQVIEDRDAFQMLVSRGGIAGILLCMLLSAAGLFALMAVGVARRTREVGIRLALGADRLEVLMSLFGRAGKQLALGIVVGLAAVVAISFKYPGLLNRLVLPLASVALAMGLVGLIAVLVPARRALRITPVIALKE